jgi:hypothetical protein
MPVRLATTADIPIMAQVWTASFGPDPLFQYLFPRQKEYPDQFLRAGREGVWAYWYDYSQVHVVSYELQDVEAAGADERSALIPATGGKRRQVEVITGAARWARVGKGWETSRGLWGRWDPRARQPFPCEASWHKLTRASRQIDIAARRWIHPPAPISAPQQSFGSTICR